MSEHRRAMARKIAQQHLSQGDALGWFEELYALAKDDVSVIPWADLTPNPHLIEWLNENDIKGSEKKALKVGCGLGDDAEELARRGFNTTAFDISPTAIAWCRNRFLGTSVNYIVADLFTAPRNWREVFDLVIEAYTLQVLPQEIRRAAIAEIARFVKPGGILFVIARGRENTDHEGKMPWPLTREDLDGFISCGLKELSFSDYMDNEEPPVRRFRAIYVKEDVIRAE